VASVTGDHKSSQIPETVQDLDQLYDIPPPAYQSNQPQQGNSSPLNSDAPMPIPFSMPDLHEDKEQTDDNATYPPPQPSPYQQSPLPMHQQPSPQVHPMNYPYPHQHHHHPSSSTLMSTTSYDSTTSSMGWNMPGVYGGIEPQYHHGQYQQLYDQLTQRQQLEPAQRPYSEFQQQYTHYRQDAGGFRIPDQSPLPTHRYPDTISSADEEKRQLAERYALEEARARQASIQTLYQEQKPLPASPPSRH
jgi:hypothetical protein